MQNDKVILFDGICNLCNRFVQFVIKFDKSKKINFCPLQSETGKKLLKEYSRDSEILSPDTVLYLTRNKCLDRSTAALYICKDMGGFFSAFFVLILIPKPIRNFAYRLVAKYRYKLFGVRDSCMVPTPDLENRFLK